MKYLPENLVLVIILVVDAAMIIIAMMVESKPFWEQSLLTDFSFIQLLAAAFMALMIFINSRKAASLHNWKAPYFLWAIIAAGFIYLSLDEVLQIHEKTDHLIHDLLNLKETRLSDRLDDVIMCFYGLAGLFIIYHYRDELKKYIQPAPFLIAAFSFFFLMTALDFLTNRSDFLKMIISDVKTAREIRSYLKMAEDIFKIFSEALFINYFYRVLITMKDSEKS